MTLRATRFGKIRLNHWHLHRRHSIGTFDNILETILQADPSPFRKDLGGVIRLGQSRITLDLVVEQYENGMTPEDMVRAYDSLLLADVHAAIAYYLRHRDEVRAYLNQRTKEAEALRTKIEADRPRISREELLARLSTKEKESAPAGQ